MILAQAERDPYYLYLNGSYFITSPELLFDKCFSALVLSQNQYIFLLNNQIYLIDTFDIKGSSLSNFGKLKLSFTPMIINTGPRRF